MFYIPETKVAVKELINEIIKRNTTTDSVDKMDYMYTIALLEAYYSWGE